MKFLIYLILFNLISFTLDAQPVISWSKLFGGSDNDYPNFTRSKIITSDGGIFMSGTTASSDGNVRGFHGVFDMWVIKLDAKGTFVWQKAMGGSEDEYSSSFVETADKGFLIVGATNSTDGEVMGNHGDYDVWVVKLSSSGSIQWSRCLGGSDADYGYSVALSPDGGYVIGAKTWSDDGNITTYKGNGDGWIVKLSANGTILWQKTLGGSLEDNIWNIKTIKDGYLICGTSMSSNGDLSRNNGLFDFWLMKINFNGVIQWSRNYGGTGDDHAYSCLALDDGTFMVAGETRSTNGDVTNKREMSDAWIVKVDATGKLLWQKTYGGDGEDWANSIEHTQDGGLLVCGATNSNNHDFTGNHGSWDGLVFKTDSLGKLQWHKQLGGTAVDETYIAQQTTAGKYLIAGSSESNDGDLSGNHGRYDFWVLELDREVSGISSQTDGGSIFISPNPVSQDLHFDLPTFNGSGLFHYEIYSSKGVVQLKGMMQMNENTSIPVSSLLPGQYFIKLIQNEKEFCQFFVKL